MRKGGCFALLSLSLVVGVVSLPWWLTPKPIEKITNYFLEPNYAVQLSDDWEINREGIQLPQLNITTEQCSLVNLNDVKLSGWFSPHLKIEQAHIDYDCVKSLPSSDNKTPLKLTALLGAIPSSTIEVQQLKLSHADNLIPPIFHDVLNADISLLASHKDHQFEVALNAQNKDGLLLQHSSRLLPQGDHFIWQGETDYQPKEKQRYQSNFSVKLQDEILQLQPEGELNLTWQNPDFSVTAGEATLSWKGKDGHIKAQDLTRHSPLLDVPFVFTQDGLEIAWGTFYWTFDGYQPIKGFLGLSLRTPKEGWLPFGIDINTIVQTFGEKGKGEIVISGENGEIGGGEHYDQIHFNLKTRGDLRYNNTVAQTNLTYHLGGSFEHPLLRFNPGSIFKMDDEQTNSKIHVRLPLDNVQISKYGLDGQLQATLKGFTAQLSDIDLKLDGRADEFIAGIKTVFQLRDTQQKLSAVEQKAHNRWDWTIEGGAHWNALKTPVKVKGVGFWQADHIELNQLMASSGNVQTNGVKIAPMSLEIKDRLRWDYEQSHIRGLMQAKSDWIEFDYGGRFDKPVFGVGLDGESIERFNIAGDLKAGALGPIDLLARYEDLALKGKISWKEQSAKIFQSLFPRQWGWLIHKGSIKGESDFTINEKGIHLQGNLNLKNANISFPDGEIENLDIHFPLNYQHNELHNPHRNPIKVSVRNMRKGALFLNDGSFNLSGTYPNSAKKPLTLSKAKIGLFNGELMVDKLNFPQNEMASLKFRNIDLALVMAMAQYNQIHVKGKINATLPFWLDHKACLICNGTLEQAGNMNIKLSDEVIQGLKQGGWTESILVDLLKEMELQNSQATINLAPNGQMNLRSTIKGFNPTKPTHHPITLNYNHQENMFELWNMIDYGAQFEQNLQYKLYQRLENEKTPQK